MSMMYKTKKTIIAGIFIGLMIIPFAYYQFIGVQGILTLIGKQGTLIMPMMGSLFLSIEITILTPFLFHILHHNKQLFHPRYRIFLKRNGIVLLSVGALAIAGFVYNMVDNNFVIDGPSFLFPYDTLLVAIFGVLCGALAIVKYRSIPKPEVYIDDRTVGQKILQIVGAGLYYFFTYFTLDRIGGVFALFVNGIVPSSLICMIPLFAQVLAMGCTLNNYEIYKTLDKENDNAKAKVWFFGSLATLALAIYGFIGQWVNLLGPDSTYVMKAYSQFYGLDRLATSPITLIVVGILAIIPPFYSLIMFIIKRLIKNKNSH